MNFSDKTFVMVFRDSVRDQARWRARSLFDEHYAKHRILKKPEERERLALQETTRFYQSGRVFFLLKASWGGPQTLVTGTYHAGFAEIYNDLAKKPQKKQ